VRQPQEIIEVTVFELEAHSRPARTRSKGEDTALVHQQRQRDFVPLISDDGCGYEASRSNISLFGKSVNEKPTEED